GRKRPWPLFPHTALSQDLVHRIGGHPLSEQAQPHLISYPFHGCVPASCATVVSSRNDSLQLTSNGIARWRGSAIFSRLSGSLSPRQWRPCGPSPAIGCAAH